MKCSSVTMNDLKIQRAKSIEIPRKSFPYDDSSISRLCSSGITAHPKLPVNRKNDETSSLM